MFFRKKKYTEIDTTGCFSGKTHNASAIHENHGSHSVHSVHSVHNNVYNPVCTTVGTTFTKLNNPRTALTFWNDLKAKIDQVRTSWSLTNTAPKDTYSPALEAKVVASEWNNNIRDRLEEHPLDTVGVNTPTATTGTSKIGPLSVLGYPAAVDYAASKLCSSVCASVCTTVGSSHTNHASHAVHTNHGAHASHADHSNHGSHANHRSHGSTTTHTAHSSHYDYVAHGAHTASKCREY